MLITTKDNIKKRKWFLLFPLWFLLLACIYKKSEKQCGSWSAGFWEASWSGCTSCFQNTTYLGLACLEFIFYNTCTYSKLGPPHEILVLTHHDQLAINAQTSLRMGPDSPKPSLLAYTKYGSRGRLSPKFRKIPTTSTTIWTLKRQNLSSGFSTKWYSNQPAWLQRLARKLKFGL